MRGNSWIRLNAFLTANPRKITSLLVSIILTGWSNPKKADLHEVPGNQRKYFTVTGNNVFFNEERPQLFGKPAKNGNLYPKVELETPMSFTMKRDSNVEATSAQLDIRKWGIVVHEVKKINDKWVRREENVVEHVPIITKPGERKSFLGCVNLRPSYITNVVGNRSLIHFTGTVFYIGASTKSSDDIPVGEFQSSLPVGTKTRSKAMRGGDGAAPVVVDDTVNGVSPIARSASGAGTAPIARSASGAATVSKGAYVSDDDD